MFKKLLLLLFFIVLAFSCSESEESGEKLPSADASQGAEPRNSTTFAPGPATSNTQQAPPPTTFEPLRSPYTRFAIHYKKNPPVRMPVDFIIGPLEQKNHPAAGVLNAFILSLLKGEPDYSYAYDDIRLSRQLTEFYDESGISKDEGLAEQLLDTLDIRIGILSGRNSLYDGKIRIIGDTIDLRARVILVEKEVFLVDSLILNYNDNDNEKDEGEWYPETFSKPFGW